MSFEGAAGARVRTMTERGMNYQLNMHSDQLRRSMNDFDRLALKIDGTLAQYGSNMVVPSPVCTELDTWNNALQRRQAAINESCAKIQSLVRGYATSSELSDLLAAADHKLAASFVLPKPILTQNTADENASIRPTGSTKSSRKSKSSGSIASQKLEIESSEQRRQNRRLIEKEEDELHRREIENHAKKIKQLKRRAQEDEEIMEKKLALLREQEFESENEDMQSCHEGDFPDRFPTDADISKWQAQGITVKDEVVDQTVGYETPSHEHSAKPGINQQLFIPQSAPLPSYGEVLKHRQSQSHPGAFGTESLPQFRLDPAPESPRSVDQSQPILKTEPTYYRVQPPPARHENPITQNVPTAQPAVNVGSHFNMVNSNLHPRIAYAQRTDQNAHANPVWINENHTFTGQGYQNNVMYPVNPCHLFTGQQTQRMPACDTNRSMYANNGASPQIHTMNTGNYANPNQGIPNLTQSHTTVTEPQNNAHGQGNSMFVHFPSTTTIPPGQARDPTSNAMLPNPYMGAYDLVTQLRIAMSLPPMTFDKYCGRPDEDFTFFLNDVVKVIEKNCTDPTIRLKQLISKTDKKARMLIKNCVHLPPDQAYAAAKRKLIERYGNPVDIIRNALDKLSKGSQIHPGNKESLLDFASQVEDTSFMLEFLNCRLDADSPDRLRAIVARFPNHWKNSFLKKLDQRMPTFNDLVTFTANSIKIVRNPFFGDVYSQKPPAAATNMHATSLSDSKKPKNPSDQREKPKPLLKCGVCTIKHPPWKCSKFKELDMNKKVEVVMANKFCINCLNSDEHMATDCPRPPLCKEHECENKLPHNKLLHPLPILRRNLKTNNSCVNNNSDDEESENSSEEYESSHEDEEQPSGPALSANATCGGDNATFLQIVPVKVYDQEKKNFVSCYAMLDSASDGAMCDRELIRSLGLRGTVTHSTIRGSYAVGRVRSELTNLTICSVDDGPCVFLPRVKAVKNCPFTRVNVPGPDDYAGWPHLEDLERPVVTIPRVMLLIGTNAQECFVPKNIRQGEVGPIGIEGILGWSILGNKSQQNVENEESNIYCSETLDSIEAIDHHSQVDLFWKLEKLNASDKEPGVSVEDRKAMKIMRGTKKLVMDTDGPHYQLSIPWRMYPPPLLNNRQQAFRFMLALKLRFLKDPAFFEMYKAQMLDYIKNGYAVSTRQEPIPREFELLGRFYMTHHGVTSVKKMGKVRVVYHCGLYYRQMCLNSCIYSGPDLANKLVKVLLRWREGLIAICGDVEAMFHRVKTEPKDYTFLRFLWFQDGDLEKPIEDHYMKVHIFGCVSSSACANFALQEAAMDNKDDHPEYVVQSAKKSMYVDDFATSHDEEHKAIEHVREMTEMLAKGGMNLKKFDSNSQAVIDSIPIENRAKLLRENTGEEEGRCQHILGVRWQVQLDKIILCNPVIPRPSTRCGVLGYCMARFDPLGLESPLTFQIKVLLQELCRIGLGWKEELPEPYLSQWHQMLEDLDYVKELSIDRCYKKKSESPIEHVQLHTFSDASSLGYASITYLRYEHQNGEIHVAPVTAKARVAPIRSPSIRRLEFQGVVTACRQSAVVVEALETNIDQTFFWTDCQNNLKYINNENRRYQVHISNRLSEILDIADKEQFHFVRSADNVADDATRKISIRQFSATSRWFVGPAFLHLPMGEWKAESISLELDENDPEVKKEVQIHHTTVEWSFTEQYTEHFSVLRKLKNSVAWLLRFISYLRDKVKSTQDTKTGHLTVGETRNAMNVLIKICQREAFPDEVRKSRRNDQSRDNSSDGPLLGFPVPKSSPLQKIGAISLNGQLCLRGRLRHNDLCAHTQHPVILPNKHHFTKLLIYECHVLHGHQGINYVLSEMRMKYWIIHGRVAIRKVLGHCMPCRRYNSRCMEQLMADLPPERVLAPSYPFRYTGTDAFGHFYVKYGRGTVKRWVIMFTDLSYRCVHLEVIHTMETDSFIMAYQRFCDRRGKGETLWSDRGSNYMGADRELREAIAAWNSQKIEAYLRQRDIEWKFNAAGASHHGGVWERLIRSMRSILNHSLTKRLLTDEQLLTVMSEVEGILNSRPLQPTSSDPQDLSPLTPNHILLMRSNPNLPTGVFGEKDTNMRKRWKVCQAITNEIAKRLTRDYLAALNLRSKWLKVRENIGIGDLVLINDPNLHRSDWSLARVTKLFPGRDGLVRSVGLKTRTSDNITRPITKICLLEGAHEFSRV